MHDPDENNPGDGPAEGELEAGATSDEPAAPEEGPGTEPEILDAEGVVIDGEGIDAQVIDLVEAEAEPPPPPPTAEEVLQARLDETAARLRAVSKAYTDAQAEMHAFRERMENQAKFKAERQAFEQARTFFEPVQNLKRSLDNAENHESLTAGLQMVLEQFMHALGKLGMEAIPGVGAPFDPKVHEALAITPVTEPEQDGRVLMVHSDGYTVNGKVLQASQVVVGKYQEPAGEA